MREEVCVAGAHSYDGSCRPENQNGATYQTFSVGCFEWLQGKHGVKKSKAKVRVRGSIFSSEKVHAKAQEICKQLDAGTYQGPKTVTVR